MSWPPYLHDTPCFWTDGTSLLHSALPFKMLHLRAKLRTYMCHIHEWHQNLGHQKYCKQKLLISWWILGWSSHFTGTARSPAHRPTWRASANHRVDRRPTTSATLAVVSAAWYVSLSQKTRGSLQSDSNTFCFDRSKSRSVFKSIIFDSNVCHLCMVNSVTVHSYNSRVRTNWQKFVFNTLISSRHLSISVLCLGPLSSLDSCDSVEDDREIHWILSWFSISIQMNHIQSINQSCRIPTRNQGPDIYCKPCLVATWPHNTFSILFLSLGLAVGLYRAVRQRLNMRSQLLEGYVLAPSTKNGVGHG